MSKYFIMMTRAIKRTILYLGGAALVFLIIDLSGVFRHPLELDYFSQFNYPLDLPNFSSVVRRYGKKEPFAYAPINYNYLNLTFLKTANTGCSSGDEPFHLILLVKSAPNNFAKRSAIRSTWGQPKQFSNVPIKTVFLLGSPSPELSKFDEEINAESAKHEDLVQADFVDSYYNNTYKTMMGMRWLVENCSNFRYAFFSDDDMYVSTRNLLKFIRHPAAYPEYWENQKRLDKTGPKREKLANSKRRKQNQLVPTGSNQLDFDIDLDEDTPLYAGYVYFLPPYRHKLGSKWYLSLKEYPYNYLPPFVPAGSVALSKSSLVDIYFASPFTKIMRFDDIFLAICAKKMGIDPLHSDYFRVGDSYPVLDRDVVKEEYLISWHGFQPETLMKYWDAQKVLGNA